MTVHALRGRTRYPGLIDNRILSSDFNPNALSGLKLWLDFSDVDTLFTDAGSTSVSSDGDAIYQVNDKSGNGLHLVQSVAAARPLYKTNQQNSLSTALFDGSDDRLHRANTQAISTITVFIVLKHVKTGQTYIAGLVDSTHALISGFTGSSIEWFNTPSSQILATQSTTTYVSANTANGRWGGTEGIVLGHWNNTSAGSYLFGGYCAEYIVYERGLSAAEISLVETYIDSKWGL